MAVTTKKTFNAVGSGGQSSTTVFTPVSIELNNQDDLDVYVTLSGGTRVLNYRQSTGSTTDSNHPQVNDTTGLYFPAQNAGVTLYNYTLSTDNNTITFNSALPSGAVVSVERRTRDSSSDYTNFVGGSTIRHTDVNRAFDESNFTAQEARNKAFEIEGKIFGTEATSTSFITSDEIVDGTIVGGDISTDTITASNLAANSVGSSELADNAVDTNAIQDNAVTMAKLNSGALPTDITVASANIVDGTIVNADVSNSASIAHSKLSGIAGGNVLLGNSSNVPTSTTLSGDVTVNSSGVTAITAGSIVTADIGNDQITNAKIADDQIDSEHYVDGSIDTAHIADANVTTAKIAGLAVTADKIADNTIINSKIAAGTIEASSLQNGCVTDNKLASNSVTTAKILDSNVTREKIADNAINHTKILDGTIGADKLDSDSVTTAKIADSNITTAKIADSAIGTAKIANDAVTADKIADAVIVTASEQASASANDTSFFTTSASDARYFNVSTGDTIKDGDTFPDNDTTIATTAAINDRIIDLVDDVGGFVPIADRNSFPAANPDVNNGAGTIVSITDAGGIVVQANGSSNNSQASGGATVTITGMSSLASTTIASGFGMLLETTSTLHTYTFHRLVPKATEVTTVAGSISNVNTVAGDISNVNAVAGNATNINAVAGNASNINSAVSNASNINSAVSNASNINSAVSNASNINTVAGAVTNVNNVGGSIANVNSVASNLGTVNDFAARYRTGANNPTDSLDTGDLFFNTSANELKVYNGSAWQGGVTASGNFASITGNTFTGDNLYNDGVKGKFGTGSDLQINHSGSHAFIQNSTGSLIFESGTTVLRSGSQENYIVATLDSDVELYYDGVNKIQTHPNGVLVNGNIYGVDNSKILLGASADLEIYHDGSHSYLHQSGTGELKNRAAIWKVVNEANSEIQIKATENAAVELYYDHTKRFSTTSSGAQVEGYLKATGGSGFGFIAEDSVKLSLGTGNDLNLYHDGTNSYIKNTTGDLRILGSVIKLNNAANTETCLKTTENGAVELYYDNVKQINTTSTGVTLGDDKRIDFGDGADLKIYHDGTDDIIHSTGSNLRTRSNNFLANNAANNEVLFRGFSDGAFEAYYDGSKKLETTSAGVKITGELEFLTASDVNFTGSNYHAVWDASASALELKDNTKLIFGTGDDLQIYHNGSHSYIDENGTGILAIRSNGTEVAIASVSGESMGRFINDGAVELYHNNVKKFETTANGIKVPDGERVAVGDSQDAYFYHNGAGSDGAISNTVGNFLIYGGGNNIYLRPENTENSLIAKPNGAVELYYDNSKKFETTSTGVTVTGTLDTTDTISTVGNLDMSDSTSTGNNRIRLGTGDDLEIYHSGSHSLIQHQNTGNLYVLCQSGQINFETGSETMAQMIPNGEAKLYYDNVWRLQTNANGIGVNGHVWLGDGEHVKFGAGTNGDLQIYHDGTSNVIKGTGAHDLEFYTNNTKRFTVASNGNTTFVDDAKIFFGTGNDLRLWHDGSHSYISDVGTGNLYIDSNQLYLRNQDTSNVLLQTTSAGAVQLNHNGTQKFATTSSGGTLTGYLSFPDNGGIKCGDSADLHVYHDGSNSYISELGTGDLILNSDGNNIFLKPTGNENGVKVIANGAVELYYDNNIKLSTTSGGVRIDNGNLLLDRDNAYIKLGASDDLQIYHDGSNSYIKQVSGATGDLLIFADGHDIELIPKSGEPGLNVKPDGAVELYYDGIKKCETVSDGLLLQGVEGGNAAITMESDEGDDHDDKWQIQAASDHTFHLKHKAGNSWKTAWYTWTDSNIGYPVFRASKGGIRFDDGLDNVNSDQWNAYGGDGHAHRTAGQAYITADDHMRFRKNGNAENKRFDLRTDTGNGQAQNDWQDDQFDFAEFFEWSDGNPNGEDRIGHTVAVDGLTGKIKIAADGDAVIGVVSGTAAFTANCAAMGWHGKYIRDEWGRYRFDLVKDEDGNQLYSDLNKKHEKITLVENPDWDQTKEYYSRDERKEWDKIGIIGQCYVRKTAVIPSSWIKLKEIDSTKDFYLIK